MFAFVLATSARSAQIGSEAPDFHATDSNGKTQSQDQCHGKYVVPEWHNHDCPYITEHYRSQVRRAISRLFSEYEDFWEEADGDEVPQHVLQRRPLGPHWISM
jgi:hypothetical protein